MKKYINTYLIILAPVAFFILVLLIPLSGYSQVIPFSSSRWEITADEYKTGNFFGKEGLFLKNGAAVVKDSQFLNGIIEFDIAVTGERGFMGALWRLQDEGNGEEFYIRPHQSGNPDANQYTPIFNGMTAWQLYYGDNYAAPVKYKFNEWMHIKIVVSGQQAEVYIIDMKNPALFIPELKVQPETGMVGINAAKGFAPAYFANFSYEEIEKPLLKSKPAPQKSAMEGTVMSWLVSDTFDSEWLQDKYQMNQEDLKDFKWTRLESEGTGIANLSRIQGISEKHNTVFCKLVIQSKKNRVKRLKFGYSDDVKVYVNGKLIYGGTNFYRSRDYRYLGTIGLFDEIFLDLHKGENIILFAVTENFGGWGIIASIEDSQGLKLSD